MKALVGTLSLSEVEDNWSKVENMGNTEEMAGSCALLCCVQRQLGYMAAFHEGNVGAARVVSQAPALPLALSWEGSSEGQVYGTSFAGTANCTLLEHLLDCVQRASQDHRFPRPAAADVKDISAKVSLLRSFTDISENPLDWTPGVHGIWYSDGQQAQRVYLPQAAEQISQDEPDNTVQRMLSILLRRASKNVDEEEEEEEFSLPEGHILYRFETTSGRCPISTLPLLQTRRISDDHVRQLLLVKAARLQLTNGDRKETPRPETPRFALISGMEKQLARAMVVPPEGAYGSFELPFDSELQRDPPGFRQVRRIFVISPVWDCFIDGCGIPEQRCAWYGDFALDIPLLEELRSSKVFQVLTVDQDQRERCIEALLPFVRSCVSEDQKFTLVPILVGGLMTEKAEEYASLLSPYLADPENLFIVGGDVETLTDTFDWERLSDLSGGPERFMIEAPKFVNRVDQVIPIFSALELFLSILATAPRREEFFLTRYW